MTTQTDAVLAILRERGELGLTSLEALHMIGSFRLAARIADAKKLLEPDEEIVALREATVTGKSIALYVLRRRPPRDGIQLTLDGG